MADGLKIRVAPVLNKADNGLATEIESKLKQISIGFDSTAAIAKLKTDLQNAVNSIQMGSLDVKSNTNFNTTKNANTVPFKDFDVGNAAVSTKEMTAAVAAKTKATIESTEAINSQKVATEKARTAAAEHRAEIAKLNLEHKKTVTANKAATESEKTANAEIRAGIALRKKQADTIRKLEKLNDQYGNKLGNRTISDDSNIRLDDFLSEQIQKARSGNVSKLDLEDIDSNISVLKNRFNDLGIEAETAGEKIARLFGDHWQTTVALAGIAAIVGALRGMLVNIKDIDYAMTELKKVTDETDATYAQFMENAVGRSQKLGATMRDVITATADFARLGYSINEASSIADAALVYKNVGDGIDNISDASSSIISTMKAFGIEATGAMEIVDKFNEVGNNFAISSAGIGEAMMRSSSALAAANNTLDESIALVTAANNVMQDPIKVGTALKVVSMYLRAAKTEAEEAGESTEGMVTSVSKLRDELLSLTKGKVDIQIDAENFKSTYQIIKELAGVWNELSDITQANILEKIGGKRNGTFVTGLLSNFQTAEDVMLKTATSMGSAMRENEKAMNSVQGKLQKLQGSFEALSTSVIDSGMVKGILDIGNALLKALKVLNDVGVLIPTIVISFGAMTNAGGLFAEVITKIVTGAKAFGAAFVAMLHNPIAWVALATGALIALIKYINSARERAIEALNEVAQKVQTLENEVETLESQLEKNRARIKEIKDLGTITLYEQNEIDKLKSTNELLETQLKVKQMLLKHEQEAQNKAAQAAWDTKRSYALPEGLQGSNNEAPQFDPNSPYASMDNTLASKNGDVFEQISDEIEGYRNLQKQLSEELDVTKKAVIISSMESARTRIDSLMQEISEITDKATDIELPVYKEGLEAHKMYIETFDNSIKTVLALPQFAEVNKELSAMGAAGNLTAEKLADPKFQEFVQILQEMGTVSSDSSVALTEIAETLNQQVAPAFEEVTKTTNEVISEMTTLESGLKTVGDVVRDFEEGTAITASSLQSLSETFGGLSEFDNFVNTITNSASSMSDVQSATESLVSAYIKQSGILKNVNSDTVNLISSQLRALGVTNAEEVATKALAQSMGELHAQKLLAQNPEFINMTLQEIQALLQVSGASQEAEAAFYRLAAAKIAQIDASTVGVAQQEVIALAGMASQAITTAAAYGQLAQAMQLAKSIDSGTLGAAGLERAMSQLSSLKNEISNAKSVVNDGAEFKVRVDTSALGGAVSAARSAANQIKSMMSSALGSMNTLLGMTVNMVKQKYQTQLDGMQKSSESARQAYDAERKALESQKDGISDYYDSQRKALEDAYEAQKEFNDAQKEAINDRIDALEKERDVRLKALQDQKDAYYFDKELAEKNKGISDLEFQIGIVSKDTSLEGVAKRKKLEEELAKQKEELDNFLYDNQIEKQEEAINSEFDRLTELEKTKLDLLEQQMKAEEKAHRARMDALDAERKAAEDAHQAQMDALEESFNAEQSAMQSRMDTIQNHMNNEAAMRKEAFELIDGDIDALYEKLLEYNREYGDGLDGTVKVAIDNAKLSMQEFKQENESARDFMSRLTEETQRLSFAVDGVAGAFGGVGQSIQDVTAKVEHLMNTLNSEQLWSRLRSLDRSPDIMARAEADELERQMRNRKSYTDKNGVKWYWDESKQTYTKFHTGLDMGAVLTGKHDKNQELIALLSKNEIVMTPQQQEKLANNIRVMQAEGFAAMVQKRTESTSVANQQINNERQSFMDNMNFQVTQGDVIVSGNMDKSALQAVKQAIQSSTDEIVEQVCQRLFNNMGRKGVALPSGA